MKSTTKNNTVQFSGFNGREYALVMSDMVEHQLYKKLGSTQFDWTELSDAEKPFVCLWSNDPAWVRSMRAILKASAVIKQMNDAYDLDVRIEALPPEKPSDGFLASGWQLLVQHLFPLRDSFDISALK